ncbi:YqaE/Pmp3 family membrane protein [Campylobacter novaezeelandiae]|uniref:YqaE/Pmp3 family membrane protein n=1 Tax=Campylobacter novaezeelandiae TaxID=2267891 RepID=UPI001037DDBE|nr:YqaE/Pmp3 family membrane protein [Campylobacter novaezeelandiae]TBR78838.1 YqaE/Pmp3 family membrane protein [Campylobacter novaezeelandiae]TBR80442.1 YqaE/Pmp3 family membrane protein [Campylobacter novaezeelandiae]TBR82203.1 YqaE/Pmp3 family membrane protein [Campylobacter novaezeelandiae]
MRLIICFILTWLGFLTIKRPFAALICLILQITLIGWLPAMIWAIYALNQYKVEQKISKALKDKQ